MLVKLADRGCRLRLYCPFSDRTSMLRCSIVNMAPRRRSVLRPLAVGHLAPHSIPACLQKIALDTIPECGLASPLTLGPTDTKHKSYDAAPAPCLSNLRTRK